MSKIRQLSNSSNCDTKAKILSSHKRPLVQLTLAEMERFFMIIIVGIILSVVGLLIETIKAKIGRYRDRNRQVKTLAPRGPESPQPGYQAANLSSFNPQPVLAKFSTRTQQPSVLRGKVVAQCFLSRLILELDEGAALQKNTKYPRLQIRR